MEPAKSNPFAKTSPLLTDQFLKVLDYFLVGSAKPGAAIFEAAVAKFPRSCARQQLVHVGDHYECDVQGAKRAGLRTVWVNARWTKPDALTRADLTQQDAEQYAAADAIVKEVGAVLAVVQRWNALAAAQEP
ncbi:unnamed protein product [Phytophthora fragariaefolia]|uniref:Unnamed protein product n=1 Tax=Phytophthora fragariaefolia TaxID=1490495 RepID=A0A9W7D4F0_9STRA|nr:unnamed protein product [Phytophthora fragariaefolia]